MRPEFATLAAMDVSTAASSLIQMRNDLEHAGRYCETRKAFGEIISHSHLEHVKAMMASYQKAGNNLKTRFTNISEVMMKPILDKIAAVEDVLECYKELSHMIVAYMLLNQYGDSGGRMSWEAMLGDMMDKFQSASQQQAQITAAPRVLSDLPVSGYLSDANPPYASN